MGASQPRITAQVLKVLTILMSRIGDEISGAEIGRTTKLRFWHALSDPAAAGASWLGGQPLGEREPP